ncbi:MAG TPA: tRNA (adenosine(37)-N6)-dimethylallyltransferase MiaA [Clostridiales bacterium]|nr:tRNA (adenosine(37)-N6)-dimethylallyltransferase MiaA [Clostridiales bacterium]
MKSTLIIIAGPTGVGKTDAAVELSRRLGRVPIISADSRQVFRGMAIGTAQPSAEQLLAADHYFIADRDATQEYNSGKFAAEALELLDSLFKEHPYVIAVGGSGLYIDALCYGFDSLPEADGRLRKTLEERLENEGLEALVAELRDLDPEYYEKVDRNNPARVLRALEVCISTGAPYSAQRSGNRAERNFNIIKIGIAMPRVELYERIDLRVDSMIAQGLEAEAHALYPLKGLNALNTVGYKELFDYFDGNSTFAEAVELIKRNSRRYAKRQMTWFGRMEAVHWLDAQSAALAEQAEELVAGFL